MALTLVQTVNPAVSTAASITASPTVTLQGSLIIVFIGASALTETVTSITDNGTNKYTAAYTQTGGTGGTTECWYAINANSTTSITVNFSSNVLTKSVFVREYSGMSPASTCFDQQTSTSGSGTAPSSGVSASTTDSNELVVSNCTCLGTSPTLSVGATYGNYTSQAILANASLHAIEDLTVTSIGAQTGTMTAGGTLPVWDIGVATFVIKATNRINNFQFVSAGSGISVTEKIK